MDLKKTFATTVRHLVVYLALAGKWRGVWKLASDSLDQFHSHVYFSLIGQEQSFLLVPRMWGSGLYEWVRKFVTKGVVNHPNLDIKFITCFVRPRVTRCHWTSSWINIHHFEKSVSYLMIPNVRGSVTDYANEKYVYAGRCLGSALAGLHCSKGVGCTSKYWKVNFYVIHLY